MNRRYHTVDAAVNAQRMLEDLDAMHYGACRLKHDNDAIDWAGMTAITKPVTEAAIALMGQFDGIETMTFNRDWYANQVKHHSPQSEEELGRS